jgi:NADH-quinone oxidoreductase subunit H
MSIHIKTVVGIFLLVDIFLGGGGGGPPVLAGLVFGAKSLLVLLVLSLVDALYARLRIDQLVALGWRVLAPLALVQILSVILMGVN